MELNSYGDLLTLYYNEPEGESETRSMQNTASKRKSIAYPFTDPGAIAVDSRKRMYVVSTMPKSGRKKTKTERFYTAKSSCALQATARPKIISDNRASAVRPFRLLKISIRHRATNLSSSALRRKEESSIGFPKPAFSCIRFRF